MKKLLYECPPDFNLMGVCHESSGAWLRYSRTRGNLQFFDPNVGCWTFDDTGGLKDHVEERLSIHDYADLFSKK